MDQINSFNETQLELFLVILNKEKVAKSPEEVSHYVQVRAGQTYSNVNTLVKTEKLTDLKKCPRVANGTLDALT
jgi:hypothetical protein